MEKNLILKNKSDDSIRIFTDLYFGSKKYTYVLFFETLASSVDSDESHRLLTLYVPMDSSFQCDTINLGWHTVLYGGVTGYNYKIEL